MSRKSRDVYSNKLFGAGQGKAVAARHLVEQCFCGLYSAPLRAAVGKRKSDNPCRWVIAFLPFRASRVNDKKVNEENSKNKKVKTRRKTRRKLLLKQLQRKRRRKPSTTNCLKTRKSPRLKVSLLFTSWIIKSTLSCRLR